MRCFFPGLSESGALGQWARCKKFIALVVSGRCVSHFSVRFVENWFWGGHLWIDWDELKNPPPIPELVSGRIGWKEHTCDVTKAEIPLDFP